MTTEIFPAGVDAMGATTWIATPTNPLTTDGASVSLATLNGATAIDVTCYLMAAEQEIGLDQGRNDDTRACDDTKREEFDAPSFTKESILHIVDPQKPGSEPGNRAVEAFPAYSVVYVIQRLGVKHRTNPELEAGDLVMVYQVTTGDEHVSARENGKYRREVKTASWVRIGYLVPVAA